MVKHWLRRWRSRMTPHAFLFDAALLGAQDAAKTLELRAQRVKVFAHKLESFVVLEEDRQDWHAADNEPDIDLGQTCGFKQNALVVKMWPQWMLWTYEQSNIGPIHQLISLLCHV
jgi:hypothetical protein